MQAKSSNYFSTVVYDNIRTHALVFPRGCNVHVRRHPARVLGAQASRL